MATFITAPGVLTAPASGFVPSGSPALWYAADRITGLSDNDPVERWPDLSVNKDDVVAAGDRRPKYIANGQNSLATVRFDGLGGAAGDSLLNGSLSTTITQPATVFMVMKQISWTNNSLILSFGNELPMSQAGTTPNIVITSGQALNISDFTLGTWKLVTMYWNSNSGDSEFRLNGVQKDVGNTGVSSGITSFAIASTVAPASFCNIEVGEIIVYNDTESYTDNEAGLMAKWGL
jgi:hypothetical protein